MPCRPLTVAVAARVTLASLVALFGLGFAIDRLPRDTSLVEALE